MTRVLRVVAAAAAIGVSTKTLRRYIRSGKLPATRLPSGHYRIDEADLLALRVRATDGDADDDLAE
jgi:excisionase family DNA binding protein